MKWATHVDEANPAQADSTTKDYLCTKKRLELQT